MANRYDPEHPQFHELEIEKIRAAALRDACSSIGCGLAAGMILSSVILAAAAVFIMREIGA